MNLLKLFVPVLAVTFLVTGCGGKKTETKTETKTSTTEKGVKDEVKVELKTTDVKVNKPLELSVCKDGKELADAEVKVDGKPAKYDEAKKVFVATAPSKEGEQEVKVNVTPKGETAAKETVLKVSVKK